MPTIDPGTILPNLIFGGLALAVGIPIVINRKSLFLATVRNLGAMNRESSKAVSKMSSPFWLGAAGVAFIVIGLVMFAGAVFGMVQIAA
ncbi:hypothetical protein R8Z57_14950 [Microbacterium sp. M3]|uniref:Uncharacterized protein n=1 Tax=Microbacterium arthrosphaerae TaxID=792652 RepID=A0ABU4H432_9MICO|nr:MULTISPECIES: hypothetical protein [Microbacterium]MDW4574076.1 hypothetical protein [Microbacterium arthrosphaerae]MDW7607931.1 hypothetical protein [Microbacterium sp. M3]